CLGLGFAAGLGRGQGELVGNGLLATVRGHRDDAHGAGFSAGEGPAESVHGSAPVTVALMPVVPPEATVIGYAVSPVIVGFEAAWASSGTASADASAATATSNQRRMSPNLIPITP